MKFIDLFCGIGGFHQAAKAVEEQSGRPLTPVFASDIDVSCQRTYKANYGLEVSGDITKVEAGDIPAHDLLFAGFPCQPFSIIGEMRGFEDTRGTLFFDVARILDFHRPEAFILENVKMLVGHRQGQTLGRIMETLRDMGYQASFRVLNALDFGVPQKRERVFIVGFKSPKHFLWPQGGLPMTPLSKILESEVPDRYFASEHIRARRMLHHSADAEPTIWHENKSGNVSKYPYSCALRAGASYNYLLVDGERRLTEREMLRLQGFPEDFVITEPYGTVRHQAGNSVAVPVVSAVLSRVMDALSDDKTLSYIQPDGQIQMVMENTIGLKS
jgi:DNA (cytosine-5)-methyltransferase 1